MSLSEQKKRILLVEDDRDIRDALTDVLQLEGYDVATAANGQEALDSLRAPELSLQPALILLDLMMPVKDGAQFRSEQITDPAIANVPVIVMSADHNIEKKSGFMDVAGFLRKPVEIDELIDAIEAVCE